MKVVYDKATQSEIDRIVQRMDKIKDAFTERYMNTWQARMGFELLWNDPYVCDPEYAYLQKRLAKIYESAVPRYLLTVEEYENLMDGGK